MRYLTRTKVYEKLEPFKNAKKLYIFCEGERKEIDYFKFFQGFASNIDIIPIPNENGKSDPIKLKQNAERLFFNNEYLSPKYKLSKDYLDEVWFVIDTDRWNEGNKINILKSFVTERNASYEGWYVAQSNPSFEIWLYYHFYTEKPLNTEVQSFTSFKEFVASKISGGFDNRSMPLEIQQAIDNAESNYESEAGQPNLYSTEVFRLGQQISRFTKTQIDRCLNELKNRPSR